MTPAEKEVIDGLRIILFIGFGVTLAAIYISIIRIAMSDPESEEEDTHGE